MEANRERSTIISEVMIALHIAESSLVILLANVHVCVKHLRVPLLDSKALDKYMLLFHD